jgi:flagellar protein FlaJ
LAEKLRSQKLTTLFSYLIVIYLSFAVFLLVLYVFATMFLPQIPASSSSYSGSGMRTISANIKEYTRLFMHASVIQGFFSGIIAGQMMGESIYDGLKHSMIMIAIAYVFFVFLV